MAEVLSAYAGYRMSGTKVGGSSKRRPSAGTSKNAPGNARGKAKSSGDSAVGAINKTGSKKAQAAAPKNTNPKNSRTKANNQKNNITKPSSKTNGDKGTVKASTATKNKSAPRAPSKSTSTNGINAKEVDQLVEQLLGDSPTNPKKLSKAEQKKKQELENYLVRQLEKDDNAEYDSEDNGEEDDESDLSSDDEGDEFTSEYTLNSYDSYTDISGEEEEDTDDSMEDSGSENAAPSSTRKRKTNEAATTKANEKKQTTKNTKSADIGVSAAKKGKSEEAKASSTRKSLPASKPTSSRETKRISVGANGASTSNSCPRVENKAVLKMEPLSPPGNVIKMNSITEGEKMFQWLLNPITLNDFYAKYWENNACLIKRQQEKYFSKLISFEAIDQMLLKHHVEFTKNIDITSYKNGVRETLNPEGRAVPSIVWDHYGQGCSIRLLNPQTFLPSLYTVNATLQEYFHCMVGANVYLTPPNSQGFAPHWDDIEAFVLQVEGRKRWRLYAPRNQSEKLARDSSKNFLQSEIGKPILEAVLEPGDMLYFSRGTIHQACTEPGYNSLHITLSVYQKQSYADLFERMMPLMLQRAIANNVEMRRGLPLHTWRHSGIVHNETDTKERADMIAKVSLLLTKCLYSVPLTEVMDAAVDQMAKKYQHEALPPEVLSAERVRTVFGSRSCVNERGECVSDYELDLRTNVRLLRANIMHLVKEEDKLRLYYYLDNSLEYCEYDPNFIEVEPEEAGSIEVLIKSYPQYVGVSQLPLPDDERKITLATALWERGLLMTEKTFK